MVWWNFGLLRKDNECETNILSKVSPLLSLVNSVGCSWFHLMSCLRIAGLHLYLTVSEGRVHVYLWIHSSFWGSNDYEYPIGKLVNNFES